VSSNWRVSRHLPLGVVLLACVEFLTVIACVYAAEFVRTQLNPDYFIASEYSFAYAVVMAAFVWLGLLSVGLYRSRQITRLLPTILRVITALMLGTAASMLFFFAIRDPYTPVSLLGLAAIMLVVPLCIIRITFFALADQKFFKRNVLVIGSGYNARPLARLRRRADQWSFKIIGFVPVTGETVVDECRSRLCHPASLVEFAKSAGVDEIVVALDNRRRGFPTQELLECRLHGIEIIDSTTFLEKETGRIDLQGLSPAWLIFGNGFRFGIARGATKRAIDILASTILLAIMSPILAFTIVAVWLEDGFRAPIFYRQNRVGLNGKLFELCKFRSMRPDAEIDGKAIWSTKGDARVTRVGNIIRRLRIDELPQVLDVFTGKMSLVGPRPERPEFVKELQKEIPFYGERHFVKPGMTGWAQVNYSYGESIEDARKKLQYDLYYVKNNSPLFDLAILMQTLEIVIWGRSNAMPESRGRNSDTDKLVDTSVSHTAKIIAISKQPRQGLVELVPTQETPQDSKSGNDPKQRAS
jgi:sugar transferase (PEP-CTERM system associated)